MNIDLRRCKPGDILISSFGAKLKYVRPTYENEYLDHIVEYLDGVSGFGSRTHDGYVFRHNRKPTDHNIIKIINKELKLERILKIKYGI